MRPNTAPKHQDRALTEEVYRKLILSFEECTSMPERQLKCPYCSHYIEGVFADTIGHVRVKCNKCKAEMVLNVAYFRRIRKYLQKSRYKYADSYYKYIHK
jgi:DNA-directed RNA polymerase subunit RPC12/RpoP